jgi:membrane fusion protein (multidrug efflux system)
MRHAQLALLAFLGMTIPAYSQQAAPTTIPVGTVVAAKKAITPSIEFVGRVEAVDRVEIKARVTGYLEAVLFKEGDPVKEGAPLYRIEKGLFEAAVKQAEGALERAKSAKVLTEIQLQRAEDLLAKASGTVVARDQALAADQQAHAAILEAEANLQTAKINLGYTDITSPISGKISRTNITAGNVVGPDKGTLTTIVSQDPMYVTFPVSLREFLGVARTSQIIDLGRLQIKLRYSDGSVYDQIGSVNFLDVMANRSTDTVLARATIANPKGGIIDGQLTTVIVETQNPEEKITVPQAALIADQGGIYVFVVEDGKAVTRRVKPGRVNGTDIVIESGLTGGEVVIVEGLQGVRPGASVRASPVVPAAGRS